MANRGGCRIFSTVGILILCCSLWSATGDSPDLAATESRLVRTLLENYVPTVPPSVPGGVKVEVEIALSVLNVETTAETLEIAGWWRLYWTDPRLAWDMPQWSNVTAVRFRDKQVWQPDVIIYEQVADEYLPVDITVYSTGAAFVSLPRKTTFACPMDLSAFPFDTQRCRFTIGSWSYDGTRVDVLPRLTNKEAMFEDAETAPDRGIIDVSQIKSFQEWILAAVRMVWKNTFYSCCPEPYPVVVVELELDRATTTYLGGMVLPLIVVTLVGLTTLLMPSPTSGAKPALCVTIMLTTATVYFVASRSTPNSNNTTLIGRLYIACLLVNLILVFFSIWTTALNLIHKDNSMSIQHFMDFFYLCDKDKTGTLDSGEVSEALKNLGVKERKREAVLASLLTEDVQYLTENQWSVIGELAHKEQHAGIYHNELVKTAVVNKIIKDFKERKDDIKALALASGGDLGTATLASNAYHRRSAIAHQRRQSLVSQFSAHGVPNLMADTDGEEEEAQGAGAGGRGHRLLSVDAGTEVGFEGVQMTVMGGRGRARLASEQAGSLHSRHSDREEAGCGGDDEGSVPSTHVTPPPMLRGRSEQMSSWRSADDARTCQESSEVSSDPRSNVARSRSAGEKEFLALVSSPARMVRVSGGGLSPPARAPAALSSLPPAPRARLVSSTSRPAPPRVETHASDKQLLLSPSARAEDGAGSFASTAQLASAGRRGEGGEGGGGGGEGGSAGAQEQVLKEEERNGRGGEAGVSRGEAREDGGGGASLGGGGAGAAGLDGGGSIGSEGSQMEIEDRRRCRGRPAAKLPQRHSKFKAALDTLGEAMEKFSTANSHPPAVGRALSAKMDLRGRRVLPLVFVLYLVIEFTGVLSGPNGVRWGVGYKSPTSNERRILLEVFDHRSGPEVECYQSFYVPGASNPDDFKYSQHCNTRARRR